MADLLKMKALCECLHRYRELHSAWPASSVKFMDFCRKDEKCGGSIGRSPTVIHQRLKEAEKEGLIVMTRTKGSKSLTVKLTVKGYFLAHGVYLNEETIRNLFLPLGLSDSYLEVLLNMLRTYSSMSVDELDHERLRLMLGFLQAMLVRALIKQTLKTFNPPSLPRPYESSGTFVIARALECNEVCEKIERLRASIVGWLHELDAMLCKYLDCLISRMCSLDSKICK